MERKTFYIVAKPVPCSAFYALRSLSLLSVLCGLLFLLTGCLSDPAGLTTRTEIRARAYTETARLEADARKYEASQQTIRTGITAATIPWVALIIMGGIVAAIVVWWQGKIWHTRTLIGHHLPVQPQNLAAQPPSLPDLMLLAQRQGYRIEIRGRTAYLVDRAGRRVGQRTLPEKRS